jgi:glycosyltransferase involved in cell wall biosynthesis
VRILDVSTNALVRPGTSGAAVRIEAIMTHLSERHEIRQFSQPRWSQTRTPGFRRDIDITPMYTEHRWTNKVSLALGEWSRRHWIYQHIYAGRVLEFFRPRLLREWLEWCDVCLVEYPWQLGFCRAALPGKPVVYSSHNIEVPTRISNGRAAGLDVEHDRLTKLVEKLESRAVADADLILAVSSSDHRGFLERYGADPMRLIEIPNGSDTRRFSPVAPPDRPRLRDRLALPPRPTVLFMSAGPKPADLAALAWVRRVAARMPETTALVVGGIARPGVDGNVISTGYVDDPVPYLQAADVSLCPVEFGGGTKIKLWDSLATGLPSVVFAETLHGTNLQDGQHVLVSGKSSNQLVAAVRRLLDDRPLADTLSRAGREHVVRHHDWRASARKLETALLGLISPQAKGD